MPEVIWVYVQENRIFRNHVCVLLFSFPLSVLAIDYHGPDCVRHKTQKFDFYTTELNTYLSFFSHNSKIEQ